MKILVNNADRTAELEARMREGMRTHTTRKPPAEVPMEISALALREARDEAAYHDTLLRLLRYRDNVDTLPFDIPHRGGWRGKLMVAAKRRLWSLLRYQHDRMTFRQNLINSLYSSALEFERARRKHDIARLEARIAELEKGSKP